MPLSIIKWLVRFWRAAARRIVFFLFLENVLAKHYQSILSVWKWKRKDAHIEIKLICPVANHFVFSRLVSDLVLVDLVTTGSISVFIEEHRIASYALNKQKKEHNINLL